MKACTPYLAATVIQLAYGGSTILIKIAFDNGLNQLVLIVYRHAIAMFLLAPFAYVLERKQRASLSFSLILKIFVLSSLGSTLNLNLFYAGLHYVSATVASALTDVVPSLTFVIAVILRMEEVKIRNARGQAKVVGTLICVGGALLFTFWKGGLLLKEIVDKPLLHIHTKDAHHKDNWIKGSSLVLFAQIAYSAWFILQAAVTKDYPTPISLNVLICFFATIQSLMLAPFFARNLSLWKLDWNVQLLTIVVCGVVSGVVYYLQTWCISKKGPVFSAIFVPLTLVMVAIFSAFAFGERLHLSSLVGAFLIVVGLYFVLWGKALDARHPSPTTHGQTQSQNEAAAPPFPSSIDQHCSSGGAGTILKKKNKDITGGAIYAE